MDKCVGTVDKSNLFSVVENRKDIKKSQNFSKNITYFVKTNCKL